MRTLIRMSAISVISLLAFSNLAHAQDAPEPLAQWNGFYGGLNAEAVFTQVNLQSHQAGLISIAGVCNVSTNFASFSPGVQLGYAHEFDSNLTLGLELNFNYNAPQTGNLSCPCPITVGVADSFSFYNRMEGSVRGRIAYALDDNRILPFITVGGSLASLGLSYSNEKGDAYSISPAQPGWLVGAGLEWRASTDWSLRAEYTFTGYGAFDMPLPVVYLMIDPTGNANASSYTHAARLALNYWF